MSAPEDAEDAAAWIPARKARLRVGPAPVPVPRADEIVVENRAVAVDPVDRVIQDTGSTIFSWIGYPFVLGSDVAGDVAAVGSAVTRFAAGDRVLAHAVGSDRGRAAAAGGAFQQRTVVLERMACPLPDTLPCEDAAVLPLALSTAACGLFQRDQLAFRHPSTDLPCSDVVAAAGGRRFVSMVTPPATLTSPVEGTGDLLRALPGLVGATIALAVRNRVRHVDSEAVFGSTLVENEVCRVVDEDFLPDALAQGRYVAAPPPPGRRDRAGPGPGGHGPPAARGLGAEGGGPPVTGGRGRVSARPRCWPAG